MYIGSERGAKRKGIVFTGDEKRRRIRVVVLYIV